MNNEELSMEKKYHKYSFLTAQQDRYILLARLSLLGFDSFEETENGWEAYIPIYQSTPEIKKELEELAQVIPFTYSTENIPGQNWNAIWEAGFQPINVEGFCGVRADFHPPMPNVVHEIIINPEMAFGTGHHATTHMMLAAMETLPIAGKKILDYGCGTGILSILAAKLNCSSLTAVDIEQEAFDNTLDNCQKNKVDHITILHGTLKQVKDGGFDIILANINRNVIINTLPDLYEKLSPTGLLLVSGILIRDQEILLSAAQTHQFITKNIQKRNGWLSILFAKA